MHTRQLCVGPPLHNSNIALARSFAMPLATSTLLPRHVLYSK